VETAEIINRLKLASPGCVLEKGRFGRSDRTAVWVEARALPEIARFLKNEVGIRFDWLENLSAIQMDGAIALTYFLRVSDFVSESDPAARGGALILRVSVELEGPAKEVDVPSVARTWAMAAPFEAEIQELFGVRFMDADGRPAHAPGIRLPRGWNGFPLRKTYVFPTRFLGITHVRRSHFPEGNA
jgi:Ni,Fe-hydrogenase III component G